MFTYITNTWNKLKGWATSQYDKAMDWYETTIVAKFEAWGVTRKQVAFSLALIGMMFVPFLPITGILLLILSAYHAHKAYYAEDRAYRVRVILARRFMRRWMAKVRAVLYRRLWNIQKENDSDESSETETPATA